MIYVSAGARLVVQVQEWLRQQLWTVNIMDDPMCDWRESNIQGRIASMFPLTSLGKVAFWWTWASTSPASCISTHADAAGTHTATVTVTGPIIMYALAVMIGRLEGLLILWRSALSEVSISYTYSPHPLTETEHDTWEQKGTAGRGGGRETWEGRGSEKEECIIVFTFLCTRWLWCRQL